MRLTAKQLRTIVIREMQGDFSYPPLDAVDMLDFGEKWEALEKAEQHAVRMLLDRGPEYGIDRATIARAAESLRGYHEELDSILGSYAEGM